MVQVFLDRFKAEHGGFGLLRLWFDVAADLAVSIAREHRRYPAAAAAQPGSYRFSEEAVRKMSRRGHSGSIGWIGLGIGLGFAAGLAGNAPRGLLIAAYSILGLTIPKSIQRARRMRDHWRGFELVLESDRILLKLHGTVAKTLRRSELVRVLVEPGGSGLAIEGKEPNESIWAPSLLTGYAELREQLSLWVPLTEWKLPSGMDRFVRHRLGWAIWFYPAALVARSPQFIFPLSAVTGCVLLFATLRFFRIKEAPLPMKLTFAAALALLAGKVALTIFASA